MTFSIRSSLKILITSLFEGMKSRYYKSSMKILSLHKTIFKVILEASERSNTESQRDVALPALSRDLQPLACAAFQIYNLQKHQLLHFQSDGI